MLVCPKCNSSIVVFELKNMIRVTAKVNLYGDKVKKLFVENGIPFDERLRELRISEVTPVSNYKVTSKDVVICMDCQYTDTMDNFRNDDMCRCGTITKNIYYCKHYGLLVCERCFDRPMCSECERPTCDLHPNNAETGGNQKIFPVLKRRSR